MGLRAVRGAVPGIGAGASCRLPPCTPARGERHRVRRVRAARCAGGSHRCDLPGSLPRGSILLPAGSFPHRTLMRFSMAAVRNHVTRAIQVALETSPASAEAMITEKNVSPVSTAILRCVPSRMISWARISRQGCQQWEPSHHLVHRGRHSDYGVAIMRIATGEVRVPPAQSPPPSEGAEVLGATPPDSTSSVTSSSSRIRQGEVLAST